MITNNNELIIHGIGDLIIDDSVQIPWEDYKGPIQSIELKEGITSIDYDSIESISNLKSIRIPTTIKTIDITNILEYNKRLEQTLKDVNIKGIQIECKIEDVKYLNNQ